MCYININIQELKKPGISFNINTSISNGITISIMTMAIVVAIAIVWR